MQKETSTDIELQHFIDLMKSLFSEENQQLIHSKTQFKELNEWSSLQTMILVNEIDQQYQIVLGIDDFMKTNTFEELFILIKEKSNSCR